MLVIGLIEKLKTVQCCVASQRKIPVLRRLRKGNRCLRPVIPAHKMPKLENCRKFKASPGNRAEFRPAWDKV